MKKFSLALTLVISAALAACGGGGSSPTPPPPVGGFTNASLSGYYAFSMSGTDSATGDFFARIGSIHADGNGNITDGVEDVVTDVAASTLAFTASTYSIQADGRGTISLFNSTTPANQPLVFSITLNSSSQGLIVQTDGLATASGNFSLQNTGTFSTASINGGYVFDFSGEALDGNSLLGPDSIVGQFQANGAGGISSGVYDENFEAGASGPTTFSTGTFVMDPTNGATYGRGTATFAGFTYFYYIVDGSRIRFIESSANALTLGDAIAQTGNVPSTLAAFTGNFAMTEAGASSSGTDTQGGRFTADGTGGLTSVVLADNDNGNFQTVPKGSISAATYTIDSNFPGTGRGTVSFTDSSLGTHEYIIYMNSATHGVIQDNSDQRVGDGTIAAQAAGPFTNGSLAGKFAFNWSGINFNTSTQAQGEEDYVGQLVLASGSSNNVTGATDFNSFSSNQGVFLNKTVTGTLTVNADGTQANDLMIKVNTSPAATIDFKAFVVDQNTIFVVCSDSDRSEVGIITGQSQ